MRERKPFLPSEAQDALPPDSEGDFLLPACVPEIGLLVGENLAVIVMTTVEGQRIGVPLGASALSGLRDTLTEALRIMRAPEGGTVQ